jgi:hypothetical protein
MWRPTPGRPHRATGSCAAVRADERKIMYLHVQRLINEIVADEPDPAAANACRRASAASSARCAR